jgi:simple sugar transport system ATP-binding protein
MPEVETSETSRRNIAAAAGVPRLELVGVTKRYLSAGASASAGVIANDRIDLSVAPGQIHAVLGENGAGKSTLMKIIYGAVRPDDGELRWNGERIRIDSPAAARRLGLAMVFQHFALFETLTVAENIWLGLDASMSRAAVDAGLVALAREHGLELASDQRVHDLSVGQRQRVEIVRALMTSPRLLILDEPTSVLAPQAIERLFATLRRIAAGGCSILYISHKLDEVRALCERCTVLRAGRVTGVVDPRTESTQSLAQLMLGAAPPRVATRATRSGDVVLEVRGLPLAQHGASGTLDLTVREGEILGIAGISGNGQAALLDLLSGEDRGAPSGTLRLLGKDMGRMPPRQRRAHGLRYVPEERIGHGTVPSLPLADNTLLTRSEPVTRAGWLRGGVARRIAARLIERFDVKAEGPSALARSLSGGNLQKFIVGREVDATPRLLIVAQPTWGLDVGATARVRSELIALADRGCAVLVVSEDLEELFEISTALMVMARGRLSPRIAIADATMSQIGEWMSGAGL